MEGNSVINNRCSFLACALSLSTRDQLQLCCSQKSQLNGQHPQILRNSVEEFLCGEREDEKKRGFSWTHGSLRVRPGFHTKHLAGSPCRELAGGPRVASALRPLAFPMGDEFHPPAVSTGLHRCPAPFATHLWGVHPLGEDGQSLD